MKFVGSVLTAFGVKNQIGLKATLRAFLSADLRLFLGFS